MSATRTEARRRLLFVAYPLLPVSDESAGGAEQILWTLERELARRGWETDVAACAGSRVAGRLIATGAPPQALDGRGLDNIAAREREHAERVIEACARREYAAVLDHSGGFFRYLAGNVSGDRFGSCSRESFEAACEGASRDVFEHASLVSAPVLVSLHLPRELYAPGAFEQIAENASFHCVSQTQRREFRDLPRLLGVVRNGIDVRRFAAAGLRRNDAAQADLPEVGTLRSDAHGSVARLADARRNAAGKRDFLLWLGRVCPEKAPHLAIEAAQLAQRPIVLAGQVYPFAWHHEYWERELRPRIDGARVRWVELPSFAEKARLLRQARALLVTSQIAETTSLVALEAMASGTPVVAFGRGALGEVVREGTGFLAESVAEMAAACARVGEIRSEDCRAWVEQEYSAAKMADDYEAMVRRVVAAARAA